MGDRARARAEATSSLTLFATHYFELTALPAELDGCANVHFDAVEHKDGIVFLHAVEEGPANQSYGLQVAQLAGVPADRDPPARARILARLDHFSARRDGDLFARCARRLPIRPADSSLRDRLKALDPDAMSPRDAHADSLRAQASGGRRVGAAYDAAPPRKLRGDQWWWPCAPCDVAVRELFRRSPDARRAPCSRSRSRCPAS